MATVTIIVKRRDGEIRMRRRERRKLHLSGLLCVELRDYEYTASRMSKREDARRSQNGRA